MRKLKLLFACLLMTFLGIGQLWADPTAATVTLSSGTNETDHITWSVADGNITIQQLKGTSSTNVNGTYVTAPRVYKGHVLSFVAAEGYKINSIEITYTGNYSGNSMTAGTEMSANVVTNNTTDVDRTWASTSGGTHVVAAKDDAGLSAIYIQNVANVTNTQLRISEMKVYYTTGGGSGDNIVKTLKSIAVSGMTTTYDQNAAFSFDGTCTATYSVTINDVAQADEQKVVTPSSVSAPDMTTTGEKTITVSYTENEVTKSTTYNITVDAVEGDVLTVGLTGVTSTSYTSWSGVEGASGAEYAGNSAKGNDAIQLRSTNNAGIVSTTSGGLIKKVKVAWNSNTADARVLNVYGSHTAYESAADLYDSDKRGTLLGTFTKSAGNGTLDLSAETERYEYVGVRSNSGAMYLESVTFVWEPGKELSSIAVKTNPTKTSYIINDAFDATGLVITATYSDASTEDIAYVGNEEKFSFAGFSSASAAAAQTITVTYGGKTTTFNVEIQDITLQSVTVSGTPTTTSYTAGDTFDPEGLTVTGHYSDNSDVVITTGITWSYPDNDDELSFEQTSIRVVATVEEIASAPYTVSGLTVAAAPLVADWVASEQGYADQTDMTKQTIAFGPSNNFSLVFNKGTNSNAPKYYNSGTAVRSYGGNTFTLSSTNYNFTQIVITFGTSDGSNTISTNVGTYEDGTWTGNSKEVTFTIGGTSGNRRISAITIDYEEALPSVATPTFSVASGTYFEAQNVTISTETAGATIYYTTDGSTPTTESSVYSTPIAVTTTMTIKAIAVMTGMDNSAVAVANYAIPVFNSLEDLAAADLTHNTTVKVSFSNVAIKTVDASKKYVTFDIQKEGKDIEIYYSAETLPASWVVGGTLSGTILAPWKRYEKSSELQCWELAPESGWHWTDLTYTSPITKTIDHVTVSGTATKTAYVDGEVFDPAGLVVTLYYTDETNEVVTDGIIWAPTTALTMGMTSVDVTATVDNTTSAVYPVSVTVSEIPTKTIAEFITDGGGRCYLVGVVSNIANSNKNATLTDNSGSILLYNISQNGAVTDFVTLEVEEGDRIKVIATTYQVYNQKDEVVAPEFVEELAPEVVAVTGVTVAPTEATIKVGKTVALTATVLPALATNTNVTWESDDTDIATVDNGVVTGVADGTAHITVTTEEGSHTATATITVEAAASYTSGEWVLVTDVAQLSLEDKIIIASTAYQKAMNTQNANNRAQADVTITETGEILTYETAPVIFTLKAGSAEGQYAFYDEDADGYLYAASSSNNYLRTQETVDDNNNASWEITITNGVASVVAQGTNTHNVMRYNTSGMFSCYASASQQPVALYKYYSTPLPRYTVTFTANGGTGDAPVVADQLEGAKFNLPSNTYTYAGHQFTGWNDGTTTYAAGASYTMPATNVTFTAQWETVCAWATVYTSNVVFTGTGSYETNSYVKIGGVDYDAQKVGATDKDGSVVVTVPAGAHTLHFHAAAWNGSSVTIEASGVNNMSLSSFAVAGDAGVKSSGTYTLANDPVDQHFHFTFDAVTETTEITFSRTDGTDHRFVMYGINQEGGPELKSLTIGGTPTTTAYEVGQSFSTDGLTVSAVYALGGVDQEPVDVTDQVTWNINPTEFTLTSQTSVTVTASLETKTVSADIPVTVSETSTPGVTHTAIVVKKGDTYYAMGQNLSGGALNAVELDGVINGKIVNVDVDDRAAITWEVTITADGATYKAQNGKYLKGNGSNTTLSWSDVPFYWTWSETYGCYAVDNSRSFYMYGSNTSDFKNYALVNFSSNASLCSSETMELNEYVDIDLTDKEFVVLRDGLTVGQLGTFCWQADIYEIEGAVFYEPEEKMEDGINFIESLKEGDVFPMGRPYLFQAEATEIRGLVSKTNTTDIAGANHGMHGTFTDIVVNDPDIMIVNKNKVRPSAGNLVSANRAYLVISELPAQADPTPAPGRRRLVLGREDAPTAIDNILMDAQNVQKVLIDGQLYIVREGKWYDVTGQQVR